MLSSVSRLFLTPGTFFVADLFVVTSILDRFFFLFCNFRGLAPSVSSLLISSYVLFRGLISLLLDSSGDQTSVSASVR